jgi:hypothetical protein
MNRMVILFYFVKRLPAEAPPLSPHSYRRINPTIASTAGSKKAPGKPGALAQK